MLNKDELKALVEQEKRNLLFYARYYEVLKKDMSIWELEKAINFHLDRMIDLLKQLNE